MKYYKCDICGNFVEIIKESGNVMICCGQKMTDLCPGTSDGAAEKHIPVCHVDGNKVKVCVGSEDHPMMDNHYIEWIEVETNMGTHRMCLKPGSQPKIEIMLADGEKVTNVYSYCNIHGLWKAK